jgi:hypothetical protein
MRTVTNEDLKKYHGMVDHYIRKSVIKNWTDASMVKSRQDVSLGNSGLTIADIRQYLLMEVVVGLQKYNPNYRSADGLPVKESTFIFRHLHNRGGQLMKRVCRKRSGYGFWMTQLEKALGESKEQA